jgi:hypothetical protein
MFVMVKNDLIHAYLDCKIVATQKQRIGISSVINELSGRSTYVIYFTHFIKKTLLLSGCIEEVVNSLNPLKPSDYYIYHLL